MGYLHDQRALNDNLPLVISYYLVFILFSLWDWQVFILPLLNRLRPYVVIVCISVYKTATESFELLRKNYFLPQASHKKVSEAGTDLE